jgi:16S rRNA (uracil1498-N3)-methyltransferase
VSQVFIRPEDKTGDIFFVRGSEAHHLVHVLRAQPQDEITLFDGAGHRYAGVLTRLDPAAPLAEGRIVKALPAASSAYFLQLYQGLPRGSKFDFVIEKAVELGVDRIVPFLSRKSPIKLTPAQAAAKVSRWSRLAKAAAKQCGRATLPTVTEPLALRDVVLPPAPHVALVFSEAPSARPLRDILRELPSGAEGHSSMMALFGGPESGFDAEEVNALVRQGAVLASLGSRTLRSETAGLAALSMVGYELGLL